MSSLKIIIFGLGNQYQTMKRYLCMTNTKIVALVDNDPELIGTIVDGYAVESPEHVRRYSYDFIILMSDSALAMRHQMIGMGIEQKKLVHYRDYIGNFPQETPTIAIGEPEKRVLILSNDFGYHGGSVAGLSLARVLAHHGLKVTIAVPSADKRFLREISFPSIRVVLVENLGFLSSENLKWTDAYAYVFANTIEMVRCAVKLAEKHKVYLWLHESIDSYAGYEYWIDEIAKGIKRDYLHIGAVSDVARENFEKIYKTHTEVEILPYGIEDQYGKKDSYDVDGILTFAVIANHTPLKGLDVLLSALHLLSREQKAWFKIFVAGKTYDNDYANKIRNEIVQENNASYLGELSREKMFELYSKADVVIIPSRRETMSLAATEAMMMKKPCIISDSAGMAEYIIHQWNGLVFKNESPEELADRIVWCIENRKLLKEIGENARKTYEEHFTMEKFGQRVMSVLERLR